MMPLETSRLTLRETVIEDADAFGYVADPRFYQYISQIHTADSKKQRVAEWIERSAATPRHLYAWTIRTKGDDVIVGNVRFWFEKDKNKNQILPGIVALGYGINPDHGGHGYMAEALGPVTDFAHNKLQMHRIEAMVHGNNIASWKALEKAGYQREAERHYSYLGRDGYWPVLYEYASVRPDLVKHNVL